MSVYFIANIKVNNVSTYQKYLDECDAVFSIYNGKYLAVDNAPVILEGSWNYTKTVIISFPTEEEFNRWYNSDEYQRLLKFRLAAADCDTILIKGND